LFFGKNHVLADGRRIILWAAGFLLSVPSQKRKSANGLMPRSMSIRHFKGIGNVRLKGVVIAEDADALVLRRRFSSLMKWKLCSIFGNCCGANSKSARFFWETFFLTRDYDTPTSRWNFQNLAHGERPAQSGRIPLVTLQRGTVQIRRLTADTIQPVTTIE